MIFEFDVKTSSREQFVDVTGMLREAIEKSGVNEGEAIAFSTHTTAALTINENADPDVRRDLLVNLARLVPFKGDYRHAEGNSDAHLKVSLLGSSERVIIKDGSPYLGVWQSLFLAEFDGPRTRRMIIRITGE